MYVVSLKFSAALDSFPVDRIQMRFIAKFRKEDDLDLKENKPNITSPKTAEHKTPHGLKSFL